MAVTQWDAAARRTDCHHGAPPPHAPGTWIRMHRVASSYPTLHHHLLQLFADLRERLPLVRLLFPAPQHQVVPAEEEEEEEEEVSR